MAGQSANANGANDIKRLPANRKPTPVIRATEEELARHDARIAELEQGAGSALWRTSIRH
jgi:DNA polymerase-3 subunit epsilon